MVQRNRVKGKEVVQCNIKGSVTYERLLFIAMIQVPDDDDQHPEAPLQTRAVRR